MRPYDCGSPPLASGQMIRELDIAANALSTNKDATKVVVAGRNLLKIFSLEENSFREEHNLKVGKQATLNFSSLDVAWSPNEDHILASAATNGAVVLWNLNKVAKNKAGFELSPDTTYQVHKRTVNKVAFNQTDASTLLSGSQDASIKLFDLRKRTASLTFENGTDSVRDIQFSPHFPSIFVAADEAGNVKCWDVRNPERPLKQFTAHTGPLLSLDFHPSAKNWVATGGRDKLIKVWDISTEKPNVVYSVQTIAPVNKVKWRPNREWHIASCSLVMDTSIHVWDIRRPFMPFASFEEHKDVATGIAWRHDPHTFLSCGKDGLLIQHLFRDAYRPADYANPVGLDIGPYGDIACAFSNDILQLSTIRNTNGAPSKFSGIPGFNRLRNVATGNTQNAQQPQQQQQKQSEQFRAPHTSSLYVNMLCSSNDKPFSMDWFIQTALQYRLSGKSLSELCIHNANVAVTLDRPQVATSWLTIQSLYDANLIRNVMGSAQMTLSNVAASEQGDHQSLNGPLADHMAMADGGASAQPSGVMTTETEADDDIIGGLEFARSQKPSTTMSSRLPSNMNADLFFGDGELGKIVFDEFEALRLLQNGDNDWRLQQEAFEPRPAMMRANSDLASEVGAGANIDADQQQPCSSGGSLGAIESGESVSSTSGTIRAATSITKVQPTQSAQSRSKQTLHISSFGRRVSPWPYQSLIEQMLRFYADNGDVQMAASVLLVLGARNRDFVDDTTQKMWFNAYIELLDRFQLSTVAALVIRLCPLPEISMMSQESTTVTLTCSRCEKPLTRGGWWCERCRHATSVCSVCNESTKGLYVWCYGCGHGGHLLHMRNWFQKQRYCPAGCGHICELAD